MDIKLALDRARILLILLALYCLPIVLFCLITVSDRYQTDRINSDPNQNTLPAS